MMNSIDIPADLLAGRTAVIAGGTGSVGRVVARAFLDAGSTVVVPSRSRDKLDDLKARLESVGTERLVTVLGDLSDESDSGRVREEILERAGSVDAAVASLGGFVPAPRVLEASIADLRRAVDGYLMAHFMVAKALLPALEERSGSYTFINGPLAFRSLFPGTGLVSIATAAQAMLAQLVMKEEADRPVRINELVIHTRFGGGDDDPQRGPVSQADVAAFLAYLASDRGAGVEGETIHLDDPAPLRRLATRERKQ